VDRQVDPQAEQELVGAGPGVVREEPAEGLGCHAQRAGGVLGPGQLQEVLFQEGLGPQVGVQPAGRLAGGAALRTFVQLEQEDAQVVVGDGGGARRLPVPLGDDLVQDLLQLVGVDGLERISPAERAAGGGPVGLGAAEADEVLEEGVLRVGGDGEARRGAVAEERPGPEREATAVDLQTAFPADDQLHHHPGKRPPDQLVVGAADLPPGADHRQAPR
jgi:hypothetical protein